MSDTASDDTHALTILLHRWQEGDAVAREELMALVYRRVRSIANQSLMKHAQATLTPTELAHEALIRLLGTNAGWVDRRHFFGRRGRARRRARHDENSRARRVRLGA